MPGAPRSKRHRAHTACATGDAIGCALLLKPSADASHARTIATRVVNLASVPLVPNEGGCSSRGLDYVIKLEAGNLRATLPMARAVIVTRSRAVNRLGSCFSAANRARECRKNSARHPTANHARSVPRAQVRSE